MRSNQLSYLAIVLLNVPQITFQFRFLRLQIYTFIWEGANEEAEKKIHKENKMVRFEWIGDDLDKDESYFEFVINQDDLTNDVSLVIVDFADADEVEQISDLWNSQIGKLKQILGS